MPVLKRIATPPGEILEEEFLKPLGMSARDLARAIDVPNNRISDLIHGRRGMSADTAIRLARYFSTTANFWMNLQDNHELSKAEIEHKTEYSRIKARELEGAAQ